MSSRFFPKCSGLLGSAWAKDSKTLREFVNCNSKALTASVSQNAGTGSEARDTNEHESDQERPTVANMVERWRRRFEMEGISEPKESIEHIMAHVLGSTKLETSTKQNRRELIKEELEKLEQLSECRLSRMPVQYIIGEWDFRDIKLKLEPPIFIPRPETEILVDHLLRRVENLKQDLRGLEIGCGSGAISLSLLHSIKNVTMFAIDTNPHACELTLRNAQELNLEENLVLLNATLSEDALLKIASECHNPKSVEISGRKFHFIVSNPPYISTKSIFKLQLEISLYEDIKALDGGEDGMKLIKPILEFASKNLEPGGCLLLEVDPKHPEKIESLVEDLFADKLKFDQTHKDFRGDDRFVEISKPAENA